MDWYNRTIVIKILYKLVGEDILNMHIEIKDRKNIIYSDEAIEEDRTPRFSSSNCI